MSVECGVGDWGGEWGGCGRGRRATCSSVAHPCALPRCRRPSSASAASPRRNAGGPRYSRGSEPPRRPQSAKSGAPLAQAYQDGLGPSLEHVRELEAQGHFTEAAKILKAKLDDLNSRAIAAGGGAAAVSARRG